jgi:tetratricopeptide (TPR) repeat protein
LASNKGVGSSNLSWRTNITKVKYFFQSTEREPPMQLDPSQIENPDIQRLFADPADTEAMAKGYLMLGIEAENDGDWEDAIDYYEHVLSLDSKDPVIRYFGPNNLAYSLLSLDRFDEAEKHCLAAIGVDQDRHHAHKNLGLACEGLGKFSDAAVCFMNASFLNREDKRAWQYLMNLLADHPEVLDETPGLPEAIRHAREYYEAHGGVPDQD